MYDPTKIFKDYIIEAYEKGYRVSEDGILTSPFGNILQVKKRGKQRYPTFSLTNTTTLSGVYGIPVHTFAAYCFYKEEIFKLDIVIRHKNSNTEDISKKNILLGSHSDNNLDKDPEVRHNAAKAARAAQGLYGYITVTEDEAREIVRAYKQYKDTPRTPKGFTLDLADKYNTSSSVIGQIGRGKHFTAIFQEVMNDGK